MSPVETKAVEKRRKLRRAAAVAVLGAALALVCHALPSEYQRPCQTIVKLCVGGL